MFNNNKGKKYIFSYFFIICTKHTIELFRNNWTKVKKGTAITYLTADHSIKNVNESTQYCQLWYSFFFFP